MIESALVNNWLYFNEQGAERLRVFDYEKYGGNNMEIVSWLLFLFLYYFKLNDNYISVIDEQEIIEYEIDDNDELVSAIPISSIEEIADVDWAIENSPYFNVETKEQLAGIVYLVNKGKCKDYVTINLMNDIDLDGLNWEPMGNNDVAFSGYINGNGYAIENMTIPNYGDYYASFIGYTCDCTIEDISFINANVNGGAMAGIVGGQIIGSTVWRNVYVSGDINTNANEIGAILGWQAHMSLVDCSSDVRVNGEPYEYASYQEMVRETTPVDETFVLKNKKGVITRDEHEGYNNLMWHVDVNGIEVMEQGGGTTLDIHDKIVANKGDECTVYMVAWTGQTYTRVSNIIQIKY